MEGRGSVMAGRTIYECQPFVETRSMPPVTQAHDRPHGDCWKREAGRHDRINIAVNIGSSAALSRRWTPRGPPGNLWVKKTPRKTISDLQSQPSVLRGGAQRAVGRLISRVVLVRAPDLYLTITCCTGGLEFVDLACKRGPDCRRGGFPVRHVAAP